MCNSNTINTVTLEPLIKKKNVMSCKEPVDQNSNHLDTWKQILQNSRIEHCSKEERTRILEIINKFSNVFYLPGNEL